MGPSAPGRMDGALLLTMAYSFGKSGGSADWPIVWVEPRNGKKQIGAVGDLIWDIITNICGLDARISPKADRIAAWGGSTWWIERFLVVARSPNVAWRTAGGLRFGPVQKQPASVSPDWEGIAYNSGFVGGWAMRLSTESG